MCRAGQLETTMAFAFYRACVVKLYGRDAKVTTYRPRSKGKVKYDKFAGVEDCFKQYHGVRGM